MIVEFRNVVHISYLFKSYGLGGFLNFSKEYHAAFIIEISQIGKILDHDIYQISQWKVIPLCSSRSDSEDKDLKSIRNYLESESNKFYYSYTYDMSHNLQDNFCYSLEQNSSIKKKYEASTFPIFRWNDFLSNHFGNASQSTIKREKWVISMIHGYYEEMTIEMYSNILSVHLISRRMIQNSGTRYNRRGLNPDGFAANYVETEQIVANCTISSKIKPLISSYVQVRGSVPIYWFQEPSMLNPKPEIKIRNIDIRMVGANKHFSDMIGLYGQNIYCLNLMKSRPHKRSNKEEILSDRFKELMEKMNKLDKNFSKLEYCHIDLKNSIKEDQDNFFNIAFKLAENLTNRQKYFLMSGFEKECKAGEVTIQFQNGISRVNCVDCLDRTNFMLNIIGEMAFNNQIKTCLQMRQDQRLEVSQKILQNYQLMWRNTGDNIALQYGGSKAHAQKDSNVAEMMYQSAKRHIANTFSDNQKQYQISVFLGDFIPSPDNLWDIKVSTNYSPSMAIIDKMQEGEFFGKQIKDYLTKQQLKSAVKIEEGRFVLPALTLSSIKVSQPYKELLLRPKLFENRKNLISEAIEKKVIKGYNTLSDLNELEEQTESEIKKNYQGFLKSEDKKAELELEKMTKLVDELKGHQNPLAFSQFFKMTESLRSKPLNYKDIKANFYSNLSNKPQDEDFVFDQTYADITKEKLINTYNIFTISQDQDNNIDDSYDDHHSRNNSVGLKYKASIRPGLSIDILPSEFKRTDSNLANSTGNVISPEVRMIIQNIPNTVKNKVKTF